MDKRAAAETHQAESQSEIDRRPPSHADAQAAALVVRPRDLRALIQTGPPWMGTGAVLVIMFIGLSVGQHLFLTSVNLENVFEGLALTLTLAVGTTFLIALGMVDLSIGAILAVSAVVLAKLMAPSGVPVPIIFLGVFAAGAALGSINGFLVARVKLSFFVATLGALSAYAALAQLLTSPQGLAVSLVTQHGFNAVQWLGSGKIAGVSAPGLISLAVLVVAMALYRYTTFGRAINAVGGNERAAELAGIPVVRVKVIVFALSGVLCGLAGIMASGRSSSADPSFGPGLELNVIAAVLLGGSSFIGGSITFTGTLIGVVFIAVLQNGLTLLNVASFWQGMVTGVVLILAVGLDRFRGTR